MGGVEGGAYLGHEAKLFSQIHQPDEISLGRFRPVTRRQSPPPPSDPARGRSVRRWEGGSRPRVRGHGEDERLASAGAS